MKNEIRTNKYDAKRYALCEGRHEMPSDCMGSIFPNMLTPTDIIGLQETAARFLVEQEIDQLGLYVTGLSVALVAVINACHELNIPLTLYHYDRDSNSYYTQEVL